MPFFHWNDGTIYNTTGVYFGNRSATYAALAMAAITMATIFLLDLVY